jgi:DNA-binding response OmpR family regulator
MPPPPLPSSKPRVLLVEDDEALRELVTEILETEGYAVLGAASSHEAVGILHALKVDLVITDGYGGASGSVLASAGDVQRHAGSTPVALFTAHRVSRETALAANFSELIEKPFDLDSFTNRVRSLLSV